MKVSILLLTYNEEKNLPRCLSSLSWCDDIVLIDSNSTDTTCEIARTYGARVIKNPFINFADQRNFGLKNGKLLHEWVLHLDADEVIPNNFIKNLLALTPEDHIDGYNVPSKTMLNGKGYDIRVCIQPIKFALRTVIDFGSFKLDMANAKTHLQTKLRHLMSLTYTTIFPMD